MRPGLDMDQLLTDHPDIQYIDAILFDLCGKPLGKRYPIESAAKLLLEGMSICAAVTLLDATGNTSNPMGYGVSDGDPDARACPVPGTLCKTPWSDGAQVLTTLQHHQDAARPIWFEPRNILKHVVDQFENLHLTPVTAIELEFYLMDQKRAEDGSPLSVTSPQTGRRATSRQVYSLEILEEFSTVLSRITEACKLQNIPGTVVSSEFAPGQFEINLQHVADPVQAADHACLLKRTIREISTRQGFMASFASKPFPEESGSGLHIHMSFLDPEGRNIFDEGPEETRIKHAIAGLQAVMRQSMAFLAPNLNAFRRFGANSFVPVTRDWGYDNRSLAFRIPPGTGPARRIEHRVAGADANPYLAMACVLAGAHHGLTQKLSPETPPCFSNAGEQVDSDLPLHIWRALNALKDADILQNYMGSDYVAMYRTVKENEFLDLISSPSPKEYEWYL